MLVSTDWLASRLDTEKISILHVGRDDQSYRSGHIRGARFVSLGDVAHAREGVPNELPPARQLVSLFEKLGVGDTGRIVIYDDAKGLLAARVFFTFDYLGHGARVALLDGGLEQWRREQRPLVTDVVTPAPQPFTPAINPDVLVTLPAVRDISWAATNSPRSEWALIDARPESQFAGAGPEADIPRPGHIPGAVGIFWERMLAGPDKPLLLPASDLRKILADAGVRPDSRVVTYCRTGVQASFAYFAAKYLGYRDVKMYDGSFIEWSRASDTEVARP